MTATVAGVAAASADVIEFVVDASHRRDIRPEAGTLWERVAESKPPQRHTSFGAIVLPRLTDERGRTALITITGDKADDRLDWHAFGIIRAGKRVK